MPLIESNYKRPPFYYINGHLETIIPSMIRKIKEVDYQRERIDTPDEDFLNIDWLRGGHKRILVLSHGLEGGSDRHYAMGMAKLFFSHGWDVAAWNNRSCNGEMNKQRILYHHAASYDLRAVVDHVLSTGDYDEVALVGISMGGGQTVRYLGQEDEFGLPKELKKAVVISAPVSLIESAKTLLKRSNRVYEKRFLRKLKVKVKGKALQYPDIDISRLDQMSTLKEFDNTYSGPLHGFKDAKEFYAFCDPYPFLKKVTKELLILNALNDPLLEGNCYPYELAKSKSNITLETPKRGGHVGFVQSGKEFTYSEERALDFLS
jgi:predicted alpha/beta-fold hydrolase